MALLKRDQRHQRHPYLWFEGLEYTDVDIHTFEERLERIFRRQIHRRRLLDIRGPLVREWVLEFFSTCRFDDMILDFEAPSTLQFQLGGARRWSGVRYTSYSDTHVPYQRRTRDRTGDASTSIAQQDEEQLDP
ncbi:hypothetical protein Tco_0642710 [Tanacetum coccineum]